MSCLLRLPQLTKSLKCLSREAPRLLLPPMQRLATNTPQQPPPLTSTTSERSNSEWRTIYRLPFIRLVAGFNRLKVHQAIFTAIITPGAFALEQAGQLPPNIGVVVAAVGVSGLLTLSIASLVARNLIGFIYINQEADTIKLSYVDYWGRRQSAVVAVDDILPFWEQARPSRFDFYQIIRVRNDEKLRFKLLQRYGVAVEPGTFVSIFGE